MSSTAPGAGFAPYLFARDVCASARYAELDARSRNLLWSVASHANNTTGECRVGGKRLRLMTGMSQATLTRARADLVDAGLVEVVDAGVGNRATKYRIRYEAVACPQIEDTCAQDEDTCPQGEDRCPQNEDQNYYLNSSENSSRTSPPKFSDSTIIIVPSGTSGDDGWEEDPEDSDARERVAA